jgi:hypothetical protein
VVRGTFSLLLAVACPALARDTREPLFLTWQLVDAGHVALTAASDANACGSAGLLYTLHVELRRFPLPMTGQTTHAVSMTKPACTETPYPWVDAPGLVPGSYRWQAMESANSGSFSSWVPFDDGGIAFTLDGDAGADPDAGFGPGADGGLDGGADGGPDALADGGVDGGVDAGPDPLADGGLDGSLDAGDGGSAGPDAGLDAGLREGDAGVPQGPPASFSTGCSCSSTHGLWLLALVVRLSRSLRNGRFRRE